MMALGTCANNLKSKFFSFGCWWRMISNDVFFVFYYLIIASHGTAAIRINYLKVPAAVKNASKSPIIMDCNYSLRPDDSDLVVKWYLNDVLVYQWIPPQRPQSFGPLKHRLDLAYRASDDPKSVYRAMKIVNPTDDLAGEYKCFVSTFTDEDFSIRNMNVFVPERSIEISKISFDENYTNFSCLASDVYPAPKLLMYKTYKDDLSKNRLPTIHRELKQHHNTRLFSFFVIASVATETLRPGSLIFCEVRIPGTGYVKIESILYYPEGNIAIGGFWNWFCKLLAFHVLKLLSSCF